MNQTVFRLAILSLLIFSVYFSFSLTANQHDEREKHVIATFREYMDTYCTEMLYALESFKKEAQKKDNEGPLKNSFHSLRISYKKIEAFSCYFFPASDRNFNGPVVPEVEDETEIPIVIEYPHGLQVLASYLWEDHAKYRQEILDEIVLMQDNLTAMHVAFSTVPADEVKIIESVQLAVIRVFTLGVAQFDTPVSNFLQEIRTSLVSLETFLRKAYEADLANPLIKSVLYELNRCISYFSIIPTADDIEFLSCYRDYYAPLSRSLAALRTEFLDANYYTPQALKLNAPTLFQTDAFNLFHYNPRGTDPEFSAGAAALGRSLFFDPLLSDNNKRSCASCHQPERAFTDGKQKSTGFLQGESLTRNAPTLVNAALQRNYFYDMRSDHLEGQIGHVLTSRNEMQSSFESAVEKLKTSPEYVEWFRKAFHGREDTVISKASIEHAISEYERTLVSLNSKFDKNVRGEENTFTALERKGFNVFMNQAKCATCHYLPLFNNMVPPLYTRSEFEIIGTTSTPDFTYPQLDSDKGRGGLYGTEIFMHAFKTPTLRNIELTAPYMHNGSFRTLEEVVEFYDRGGGKGLGLEVPNQTLPEDSLKLSPSDKESLIAFLKTLTDTTDLTWKPASLPNSSDASLNLRTPGGEY